MPLDFKQIDIHQFLYAALPVRFQDTDPRDFEDFIGFLFLENGYRLEQTSYSGDFGADLIVERDSIRTAVQVKRFHATHKVGVQEVNQVIGAEQYYDCTNSMVVTASSFTRAAHEIADAGEVLLWDWDRLQQAIQDTFLDGMDYYEYFRQNPVSIAEGDRVLEFMITDVHVDDQSGKALVRGEIENNSDENIQVYCDLPIYITRSKKQFSAIEWTEDSFTNGMIYNGASVEVSFLFSNRHLSELNKHDRIILTVHQVGRKESIHLEHNMDASNKACYLISYSFGRGTRAYSDMILFRDAVLAKHAMGRAFIQWYYRSAPIMIRWIDQVQALRWILRAVLWLVITSCRMILTAFGIRQSQVR